MTAPMESASDNRPLALPADWQDHHSASTAETKQNIPSSSFSYQQRRSHDWQSRYGLSGITGLAIPGLAVSHDISMSDGETLQEAGSLAGLIGYHDAQYLEDPQHGLFLDYSISGRGDYLNQIDQGDVRAISLFEEDPSYFQFNFEGNVQFGKRMQPLAKGISRFDAVAISGDWHTITDMESSQPVAISRRRGIRTGLQTGLSFSSPGKIEIGNHHFPWMVSTGLSVRHNLTEISGGEYSMGTAHFDANTNGIQGGTVVSVILNEQSVRADAHIHSDLFNLPAMQEATAARNLLSTGVGLSFPITRTSSRSESGLGLAVVGRWQHDQYRLEQQDGLGSTMTINRLEACAVLGFTDAESRATPR